MKNYCGVLALLMSSTLVAVRSIPPKPLFVMILRTVTERRRAGLSDGYCQSSVELAVKQLRNYAKKNNEDLVWPPEDVPHPVKQEIKKSDSSDSWWSGDS